MSNQPNPPNDGRDALSTNAWLAVGLLTDAIEPDTYRGDDVAEAKDHLLTALEGAPADTEAARRSEKALEFLDYLEGDSLDERRLKVRDALAELAPIAAGITPTANTDPSADDEELPRDKQQPGEHEKPRVPVFYPIPPEAGDRAIDRFKRRVEAEQAGDIPDGWRGSSLIDYLTDEIESQHIFYIDGEPYAEYASEAGLETLSTDPNLD